MTDNNLHNITIHDEEVEFTIENSYMSSITDFDTKQTTVAMKQSDILAIADKIRSEQNED